MLSYENPRNLSLNLNLQNTTAQLQNSLETEQHEHDETIDENTKLLKIERQNFVPVKLNGNGNQIKTVNSNKVNYNMNITNNNLCNNNLISSNHHNETTSENGGSEDISAEIDSNENNTNNNDETNSCNNSDKLTGEGGEGRKIIKMTKLGSKNVTLKR